MQTMGRDSSVGIDIRFGLNGPGIESRCGRDFPHPYRPGLGPTQPTLQRMPGAILATIIIILPSILLQVHSLFDNEFSTECHLLLSLSISSILAFPESHPVASYVFYLVFPSLLYSIFHSITRFRRHFLRNLSPI